NDEICKAPCIDRAGSARSRQARDQSWARGGRISQGAAGRRRRGGATLCGTDGGRQAVRRDQSERWPEGRAEVASRTVRGVGRKPPCPYSGFAPENLTTFAHFSVSSARSFPKSAGEPPISM